MRGIIPILSLAGAAGQKFNQIMDDMAHKTGATADAVNKMKTPGYEMERMFPAALNEAIKFSNSAVMELGPVLKELADNMDQITHAVTIASEALFSVFVARLLGRCIFFDPELDMGRVHKAAMAARIHDDILRMPMQYLSLIGDMGSVLSGGQKQRILLARALYREPKILILDEGTANIDPDTEESIADLVAALPITRIVVAHRAALLARAGRVLLLRKGRLEEIALTKLPAEV